MKIRAEYTDLGNKDRDYVEVGMSDGCNAEEFVEALKTIMIGVGYHPDTVNEYLGCEERNEEDDEDEEEDDEDEEDEDDDNKENNETNCFN